jgi:cardiolipin synthase
MDWLDQIAQFWPHLAAAFGFLAALFASIHALLHKRDSRAATLWLGILWFLPLFGAILYLTLGVNRVRRRALVLRGQPASDRALPEDLGEPHHEGVEHLRMIARVVERVVARPLMAGNRIRPLVNGDEAFPAMLAAIDSATQTISMASYIFDHDASGNQFVEALGRAVQRGVQVRVLVDAAGLRYSWPSVMRSLRRAAVPCAKFLPSSLLQPWRVATINLRNHRKLLILDGKAAFTGGMNIRHGNVLAANPHGPVQDLHFRVEGPVVGQLQEIFAQDWSFTTREVLEGANWFPEIAPCGNGVARAIADGPDADFEKLRWTLLAALAEAETSVKILTPYFLPDPALVTALNLAAVKGARVDIILPEKNNLPFVQWASRGMWWQVLERGCHLWLTPPPFDHSKLMIVDGHWVLFGSANWDTRSLRLNFELGVESYGRDFAEEMDEVLRRKTRAAREITLAEVDRRALPARLRDAASRLFSPFL